MADVATFKGLSGFQQATQVTQNEALLKGFAGHFTGGAVPHNDVVLQGISGLFTAEQLVQNEAILKGFSGVCRGFTFEDPMAPNITNLGNNEGTQLTLVSQGQTKITVKWTEPNVSEIINGEHLGQADGNEQNFVVSKEEIRVKGAGDVDEVEGQVYEVTKYSVSGGNSTLAQAVNQFALKLVATSITGFNYSAWVEISEGGVVEYVELDRISGSDLFLRFPTSFAWTTSATIKSVNTIKRTITTDFTLNRSNGLVTLLSGKFTSGKEVFIRYAMDLDSIDHYELYRVAGNVPFEEGRSLAFLLSQSGVTTVDNNIANTVTSCEDTLPDTEGGETLTYYLISKDVNTLPSKIQALMIESIPDIPLNLDKTVGILKAILTWTFINNTNIDGVNVFRCDGLTFVPANAVKVNSIPVTGTSFEDGSGNGTTRRPSSEVPYPSGEVIYRVESVDSDTDWDGGTENQSDGVAEDLIANKVEAVFTPPDPMVPDILIGEDFWSYDLGEATYFSNGAVAMSLDGNYVYATSQYKIHKIDIATGLNVWTHTDTNSARYPTQRAPNICVPSSGLVFYISDAGKTIYLQDNGATVSRITTPYPWIAMQRSSHPIRANGDVVQIGDALRVTRQSDGASLASVSSSDNFKSLIGCGITGEDWVWGISGKPATTQRNWGHYVGDNRNVASLDLALTGRPGRRSQYYPCFTEMSRGLNNSGAAIMAMWDYINYSDGLVAMLEVGGSYSDIPSAIDFNTSGKTTWTPFTDLELEGIGSAYGANGHIVMCLAENGIASWDIDQYSTPGTRSPDWYTNPGGSKSFLDTPSIDSEGNIYVGASDGTFYVLNSSGTTLYSWVVPNTPRTKLADYFNPFTLLTDDGKMIFCGSNGVVYCKRALAGPANSGWSMMGANQQRTFSRST